MTENKVMDILRYVTTSSNMIILSYLSHRYFFNSLRCLCIFEYSPSICLATIISKVQSSWAIYDTIYAQQLFNNITMLITILKIFTQNVYLFTKAMATSEIKDNRLWSRRFRADSYLKIKCLRH